METIAQLLPFLFLIAIMYFVIIRPQQQEAKAREAGGQKGPGDVEAKEGSGREA